MAGGDARQRVDDQGFAFAGSQRQTQLWINDRPQDLNAAMVTEFPDLAGVTIEWRSPLADDGYREYQDRAFLEHLDLPELANQLPDFWPSGGPVWDALAVVNQEFTEPEGVQRPSVLLVEGKSYPEELRSDCSATSEQSRALIEASLARTQYLLGVADRTGADWMTGLYQSANRLAHLAWLRSLGVRAWLVHLLFVDDPHRPTSALAWKAAMVAADEELGLGGRPVSGAGHLLLPAIHDGDDAPSGVSR